jgi:plastocyanin
MRGSMRRSGRAVAAAVGILVLLSAPVVLAADTTIQVADFSFPATTTIQAGDTVTWTNSSGAAHTATADGGSFDTGTFADGASASVAFDDVGSFPYHCAIHASMTGTIVVEAAGGGATVTPAPTDTAPAPEPARGDPTAFVLAVIGVAMLVGTLVANRRFAKAHASRGDED